MSRKKRTYSLRGVKDNYTYSVEQIAVMFGIDIATVRRWIRVEGLERIPKARPHLVHSSSLKSFLHKRQSARKHPCKDNEVYCFRCRSSQMPKFNSGKATLLPNGSIRFQGKCSICDTKLNKPVKGSKWSKNHPLALFLPAASMQHNGDSSSPRECPLQEREQLCLNITP